MAIDRAIEFERSTDCASDRATDPPIEQVINAGLVPELVKFLDDRFATVLELGDTGYVLCLLIFPTGIM